MLKRIIKYLLLFGFLLSAFLNAITYIQSSHPNRILIASLFFALVILLAIVVIVMDKVHNHNNLFKNLLAVAFLIYALCLFIKTDSLTGGGAPTKISDNVYALQNHTQITYVSYNTYLLCDIYDSRTFTGYLMTITWGGYCVLSKTEKSNKNASQDKS